MNFKKTKGKQAGLIILTVLLTALIILPVVSSASGENTSLVTEEELPESVPAPEVSLPAKEETAEDELVIPMPAPSRPVKDNTENLVDVGLSYGSKALKKITLTASENGMLTYGGDVHKEMLFTWEDGVMYFDGVPCQKAYIRSASPIILSTTGWGYEGMIILTSGEKGITVVNRVDIETYVKGVMSAEIGADGSFESRKAFSVICRTLVYVAKDHGEDFDLCNRNCCQSYRGTHHRDELNDKAVDETKGIVLTYKGEPCLVAYSSSHGYSSCSSFAAWIGADIPYLRVVRYENEPLDYGGEWTVTYTYEQLSKKLKRHTTTGVVKSIAIAETDPYGGPYVYRLKITDTAGNVSEIKYGGDIMAALDIRCANFTIEYTADGVILHGIGNGHGVGYSQRGGHQMGVEGYKWDYILNFYFPGTKTALSSNFSK